MITLQEASIKQLEQWDSFIENSINGTLFHKREFLSYHLDRFKECEIYLVILKGNTVIAQISAKIEKDDKNEKILRSPYGGSYGGFVLKEQPTYRQGREMIECFQNYLINNNIKTCFLTHAINYDKNLSMDSFYFNLFEAGYLTCNRDISHIMYIRNEPILGQVSASIRNQVKNANKKPIYISSDVDLLEIYNVLAKEKSEKYHTKPTHTLEEFLYLHNQFPNDIFSVGVEYTGKLIAGITCFKINKYVNSSFYLCMNEEYKDLNALRPLIINVLEQSKSKGIKVFDFGTSSNLMEAFPNIFSFKEGFTRNGIFRETLKWENQLL